MIGRLSAHVNGMKFGLFTLLFLFVELAGFVGIAEWLGFFPMFALILGGMVAGILIIRHIGMETLTRMRAKSEAGEEVGAELGALVLGFLGGVLLFLPGFFTDMIGLLLLIRPLQVLLWPRVGGQVTRMDAEAPWRSPGRSRQGDAVYERHDVVIEVQEDGVRHSDAPQRNSDHRESPWRDPP